MTANLAAMGAQNLTWGVVALAVAGVIFRPFGVPEAIWAVAGGLILVSAGLLPPAAALHGMAQGADVYEFLTGMMLLAELARREILFDWLAAKAARFANASGEKLFLLVYAMGTAVTMFLSNDATAVVLTPAVASLARAVKAQNPLPYLLICAFIANAASFVLPISNPANLVIYGAAMPPLLVWLPRYALPSALAITATFLLLGFTQRGALRQVIGAAPDVPALPLSGRLAGCGIIFTGVVLMSASTAGLNLGLPTLLAGLGTAVVVLAAARQPPWGVVKDISWGVLPLVAGLFVMVAALDSSGLVAALSHKLRQAAGQSTSATVWASGLLLGFGANLVNNLPAGLIAGHAVQAAQAPGKVTAAVLIGVDLGPNLSVTGSLATILWLTALRRDGVQVSAWQFLKLGLVMMPPALLLALGGLFVTG
jgi:arsenical pump membrane protein